MYIKELYRDLPTCDTLQHIFIGRDGEKRTESEPVLKEHHMDVYVNEQLTMKLVCIPQYLTELTLGRLMTEGIIRTSEDVEQIYICEAGLRAKVMLSNNYSSKKPEADSPQTEKTAEEISPESAAPYIEETPSCCTDNHILNDRFSVYKDLVPVTPVQWEPAWIFDLADRFAAGMPLHQKTWATHSCFLSCRGKLLFSCEDIGRHNALDKAIGFALRNQIDLQQCVIYSSGRIPVDMATKAIRAGIPVLASKASPTAEAAELAKKYGLTLLCAARRDRMKQYA